MSRYSPVIFFIVASNLLFPQQDPKTAAPPPEVSSPNPAAAPEPKAEAGTPDAAKLEAKPEIKPSDPAKPLGLDAAKMTLTGAPVDPHAYVIGPEDVLFIRVWRQNELSGQVLVRPDGKITLPLLPEVQAAGLTPEKLTQVLTEGWSKLYTRPEVSVAVQQVNSKRYFIQGEVMKPGPYPLVVPTTVLEALVNAGGFKEFGNPKKIVI